MKLLSTSFQNVLLMIPSAVIKGNLETLKNFSFKRILMVNLSYLSITVLFMTYLAGNDSKADSEKYSPIYCAKYQLTLIWEHLFRILVLIAIEKVLKCNIFTLKYRLLIQLFLNRRCPICTRYA